jgi:hypothetical protein
MTTEQQLDLFETTAAVSQYDEPIEPDARSLARKSDPVTSKEAAERIAGVVSQHESMVLQWLRDWFASNSCPPTGWELACQAAPELTGNKRATPEMLYDIIHKRLRGMVNKGLVVEAGKRPDKLKGSNMMTWRVAK